MKIKLLVVGKTDDSALKQSIEKFEKRLQRYVSFVLEVIPDIKRSKKL